MYKCLCVGILYVVCLRHQPRLYASLFQALVKAQLKMGADRESRKRAWEENELSSLAKAIVKFPAGSQNRELAFSYIFCRVLQDQRSSRPAPHHCWRHAPVVSYFRIHRERDAFFARRTLLTFDEVQASWDWNVTKLTRFVRTFSCSVLRLVDRRAGWEHISQFIAQATRAKDPFSKEDCIAKYQQIHAAPAGPQKIVAPSVAAAATATTSAKSAPERPSRREPRVRDSSLSCLRNVVMSMYN